MAEPEFEAKCLAQRLTQHSVISLPLREIIIRFYLTHALPAGAALEASKEMDYKAVKLRGGSREMSVSFGSTTSQQWLPRLSEPCFSLIRW